MPNEINQSNGTPEPGWVFHPDTGKITKSESPKPNILNSQTETDPAKEEIPNTQPTDAPNTPESIPAPQTTTKSPSPISWSASEYVAHDKSQIWYFKLGFATVILGATVFFITRDVVSVVVLIIFAILFGIIAGKKPQVVEYVIDQNGLTINNKNYPFATFKSFSVMEEGAIDSIQFLPLKRFAIPLTIYFSPDEKQQIVDNLTYYLPYEDKSHDVIERAMHRIRF